MNHLITYRITRLRGWVKIGKGLLGFCIACSPGAISNLAVAKLLADHHVHRTLAGMAGILFGSVWNHGVAAVLTWHIGQMRARERTQRPVEALALFEKTRMPA